MEPMVCYQCGYPLSEIKEAFDLMRQIKTINQDQTTHVSKRALDPKQDVNLVEVFKVLHVNKVCCSKILTGSVNFHDLEL
jgi:DNA-directed RNA polymerase subunit N (RpoN/RPB10)